MTVFPSRTSRRHISGTATCIYQVPHFIYIVNTVVVGIGTLVLVRVFLVVGDAVEVMVGGIYRGAYVTVGIHSIVGEPVAIGGIQAYTEEIVGIGIVIDDIVGR